MQKAEDIVKNGLCLGCGLCEAVSKGKIKMILADNGFYKPSGIETGKWDDVINKVCPGINVLNKNRAKHFSIWGNVLQVSNAWATDTELRRISSSGGVTSSLAIYLLETHQVDGVLHVGVQEGSHLYNKLYVSRNREDIMRLCGSRYAPANVFSDITNVLDSFGRDTFAFIGKPCDIAALKNFMAVYPQYEGRIKFFLAIFCAGMPSYNATERAIDTFKKNATPLTLRYRGDGWPGYFTVTYSDGSFCRMTYNESWGKILGREVGFRCKICADGIGLLADIASGDAWNTKDGYPDFTEADGRNFCFIRTTSGLRLFEEAEKAGYIVTEKLNVSEVKDMQRPQYMRRQIAGWRIAVVQILTHGMLNFQGIGFYRLALKANWWHGFKNACGTAKRLFQLK